MSELKDRSRHQRDATEKKREFQEQVGKQEVTVKDKTRTSEVAQSFRQEGTREGADRVRRAMEAAGRAIDARVTEQKGEHDKAAAEGKKTETEIGKASEASGEDAQKAERLSREIKTEGGRDAVAEARDAAKDDQRHLSDLKQARERDRQASEEKTRAQVERVKSTQVRTKK
jgi:hypothetical protein